MKDKENKPAFPNSQEKGKAAMTKGGFYEQKVRTHGYLQGRR